ncbi:bacterial nucleoid DNA-binding protein [Actinobacteria bacterium IMCC26256]|nr:bacterial nucleoid DNA-binding protein [Actinobacteria bacterium IMCC26256]
MNRRDLVLDVAERTGSDRKTADAAVSAVVDSITAAVAKGDSVSISGFAKFYRRMKPATKSRKGTNPFTGEPMTFQAKPATKTVKVTPLKAFKDVVASGRVPAAKKAAVKKTAAKKTAAKKAPARKTAAKKVVKKAPARKTAAKKVVKKAAKRR